MCGHTTVSQNEEEKERREFKLEERVNGFGADRAVKESERVVGELSPHSVHSGVALHATVSGACRRTLTLIPS
jgi:hypothetical protein